MAIEPAGFAELELRGLSRSFGEHRALADVDLTVRRGDFVALLGPSGCGKSTTLNCIAGLLTITAGEILLDGRRIDGLRPEQRGFGMVFQNYALFPHMTVRQNVGFGLRMRGVPRAEANRRIDQAIGLVRLQGHDAKLPGQLSGGQQQRVAIARAVVIEPALVLMDEPLSNLDAALRLEMRAEIRRIHDELGTTTVYVTHDQEEALSMADRIVVLRDGAIRQIGTPEELYRSPASLDVAEFMGFRNRVAGRCIGATPESAELEVGGAVIRGRGQGALTPGGAGSAAFRPEDAAVDASGQRGLRAKVKSVEYRGRDFVGTAATADGLMLVFQGSEPVDVDRWIALSPDPARVLIFPSERAAE